MNIVDLQIRIARKMASGRGSIQLSQTDLNILVQSGAYGALCEAATEELKADRAKSTQDYKTAMQAHPISIRGFEVPDDVAAAIARSKLSLNQPARSRPMAPILPALIKSSDRR